jgi:WD40 repeat protein
VGSSGCGKSSLVRAGLIPALRGGFLVAEREAWHTLKMQPGDEPMLRLAAALAGRASDPAPEILAAELLAEGSDRLVEQLHPVLAENRNVLILIDQFEEIRNALPKEPQRREAAFAFVSLILSLAQREGLPIYTVLTMRSDFIGECDVFPGLPELLNRSLFLVPRLTRRQRREAVEGPVRIQGAAISHRLLDLVLNESDSDSDQLPVLQHALLRTWDEWHQVLGADPGGAESGEPPPLDLDHYQRAGRVANALDRDANAALASTDAELARRVFQTLTETDVANRRVRYPARLSELCEITGATAGEIGRVITAFSAEGRCFLVGSATAAADPLIDITHESLIRRWDKLRGWANRAAESAAMYRRLERATHRSRDGGPLLRGLELRLALEWREQQRPNRAWARRVRSLEAFAAPGRPSFEAVEAFLDRSRRARTRRLVLQRSAAVFGLATLGLAAIAMAAFSSLDAQVRVDRRASRAQNIASLTPQRGLLYAASAMGIASDPSRWSRYLVRDAGDLNTQESEATARRLLSQLGGVGIGGAEGLILALAVSPDSRWLVAASADGSIVHCDLQAPPAERKTTVLIGPEARQSRSPVSLLAVAAGAGRIALSHLDGQVEVVSGLSGQLEATLTLPRSGACSGSRNDDTTVSALALSASGRWLAVGRCGSAWVWDIRDPRRPRQYSLRAAGREPQSSSGGGRSPSYAIASVRMEQSESGQELSILSTYPAANLLSTWRLGDAGPKLIEQPPPFQLKTTQPDGSSARFTADPGMAPTDLSSDGSWMVRVDGADGSAAGREGGSHVALLTAINIAEQKRSIVQLPDEIVTSVKISPAGKWIAAKTDDDGYPHLWRLAGSASDPMAPAAASHLRGHDSPVTAFDFSADGHWLITGAEDGTLHLWDLNQPDPSSDSVLHRGDEGPAEAVALTADGRWLALGYKTGVTRIWKIGQNDPAAAPAAREQLAAPAVPDAKGRIVFLKISGDRRWLLRRFAPDRECDLTAVDLWDLRATEPRAVAAALGGEILDMDKDGTQVVVYLPAQRQLQRWRLAGASPSPNGPAVSAPPGYPRQSFLSNDGKYLAWVGDDAVVWLSDLRHPRIPPWPLPPPDDRRPGDQAVTAAAFSADSQWFAVGRKDGRACAWRTAPNLSAAVDLAGHTRAVTSLLFLRSAGGEPRLPLQSVVTTSLDGTARLFDLAGLRQPRARRTFRGHKDGILTVWANQSGTKLVTGGERSSAWLWDIASQDQEPIVSEGLEGSIPAGGFGLNDKTIRTVGIDGTVREWALDPVLLARRIRSVVSTSLHHDDWCRLVRDQPRLAEDFRGLIISTKERDEPCPNRRD